MRKIYNILLSLLLMTMVSSCLKFGLDELPKYEGNEITNFKFEYRWWDEAKNKMCIELMNVKTQIDSENHVVSCEIVVPKSDKEFPEEIRDKVTLSNLVGYCTLSTAARIDPVGNSPKLGEIQDFSSPEGMQYKVTAANRDSKIWTLKIVSLTK